MKHEAKVFQNVSLNPNKGESFKSGSWRMYGGCFLVAWLCQESALEGITKSQNHKTFVGSLHKSEEVSVFLGITFVGKFDKSVKIKGLVTACFCIFVHIFVYLYNCIFGNGVSTDAL